MLQVVPKWRVEVVFASSSKSLTFWVFDNHMGNVLRKVADMQFSDNPLEQPERISISSMPVPRQEGVALP